MGTYDSILSQMSEIRTVQLNHTSQLGKIAADSDYIKSEMDRLRSRVALWGAAVSTAVSCIVSIATWYASTHYGNNISDTRNHHSYSNGIEAGAPRGGGGAAGYGR